MSSTPSHLEPPAQRLAVTVCTFNERENIARLIPLILEALPQADVLVVDDSSPDGTANVVRMLGQDDSRVKLLLRTEKSGLGAATLAGFQWAIDQGYDFVLNMDADFSHHPRHLPAVLRSMLSADVAIGSRYVPGGEIVGWSLKRHVMSQGINVYSRVLLGLRARDCSGAFRCYRIAKLREIDFTRFRSRGYAFQEEMLYRCARVGCRMIETPITFEDRIVGQSKINLREMLRAVRDLFLLGLDRLRDAPGPRR